MLLVLPRDIRDHLAPADGASDRGSKSCAAPAKANANDQMRLCAGVRQGKTGREGPRD